jgi:cytochrome c556
MKKMIALCAVIFFAIAVFAFAENDTKTELRPAQKVMQARVAWLGAINKNLEINNFEAITKDANELSAQAKKVGGSISNPVGKELTLAISVLADGISEAAATKDAATIKTKLARIKGNCAECHTKIRDKK